MGFEFDFGLRVRAPRPVVFEKFLRIEHLARWFCGWSRIEPRVGGKFLFGGETCLVLPEGRGWETTIDEGETLRRFAFTWPIRGTPSRVSYELEDAGAEATLVRVRHTSVPIAESTCGTMQDAWRMCLGNLKSISEGRSDSVRPDHVPVTSPELRLSNLIEAPPERIFSALTDPAEVDDWSSGGVPAGNVHVELRSGGGYSLDGTGGPDRILEFEPARHLTLRWPRAAGDLRIDLSLEPKSTGTAIYLVSTGYRESESAEILRHRGRWSDLLVCLKNFIEGGDAGFANRYHEQMRGA